MPEDATADERFMRLALDEAHRALARGEVPVGAIVVFEGRVVGRGHNLRETTQDPTAHAELIATRAACARLGSWRLENATVYVTLEPCPMCAGTLVNARVKRVVWGADDPKAGAARTLFTIGDDARLNHRFEATSGVLAPECSLLLKEFFASIRKGRRHAM